jgi:aminoglycoside phosphotransferase (APT) family kinase protein
MSASVSSPSGIDTEAVETWLVNSGQGAVAPIRFTRLGHGKSNLTVMAEDARGRRWVLRRPPLGHVEASAHDVVREQRILTCLEGTGVPAPRVLALTEDPCVTGAPLVLLEHIDGIVLASDNDVGAIPLAIRHELGLSLVRTLAQVHGVDLQATGLTDLASHKPYAPRQLRRWLRQWEQSRTREAPLVTELARVLAARAPQERDVALLHGDFHLQNVILTPGEPQVRAVVDWELSTLGDPLADLGTLLCYWPRTADDPVATLMEMSLPPAFPSVEQLVDAYAGASGRDVGAVRYWQALGYWKLAIIAEGVRRRGLNDPRNGEPLSVELIDRLLEGARDQL